MRMREYDTLFHDLCRDVLNFNSAWSSGAALAEMRSIDCNLTDEIEQMLSSSTKMDLAEPLLREVVLTHMPPATFVRRFEREVWVFRHSPVPAFFDHPMSETSSGMPGVDQQALFV